MLGGGGGRGWGAGAIGGGVNITGFWLQSQRDISSFTVAILVQGLGDVKR